MSAKEYTMLEIGLSADKAKMNELEGLSLGELESIFSTTQYISNVFAEQKKS